MTCECYGCRRERELRSGGREWDGNAQYMGWSRVRIKRKGDPMKRKLFADEQFRVR